MDRPRGYRHISQKNKTKKPGFDSSHFNLQTYVYFAGLRTVLVLWKLNDQYIVQMFLIKLFCFFLLLLSVFGPVELWPTLEFRNSTTKLRWGFCFSIA